ncbi:type VII secretion protein EccB [Actinotalea sp. JY-7876]|uniref:type VII secretion protein EccB n=1 Tax=Actinotalea sp. JY-7876 TaxID=2758442 RepID=UPI0015F7290E|nr:type VII secretion protein EccB [Actinotalea sp. JY-7876]
MANKKDLVEAQTFSRRRLLTAFVSGAPGGRELEPTKPLRAVITGVALTGLLVVGSLVFGLLVPGLPNGWDHNSLIVTRDAGARYVALDGTLYPVLNTASARLLIEGEYRVIQVDDDKIASAPRGETRGIPGAPDDLPTPASLISSGWLSCTEPQGGLATVLATGEIPDTVRAELAEAEAEGATPPGLLVQTGGDLFLVSEGLRHLIPRADAPAVLRALGQETVLPWEVSGQWLNLFPEGADLDPLTTPGAGEPLPDGAPAPPGAVVGSVISVTDTGARYVVDGAGALAPLSPFALELYRIGSGVVVGQDVEVQAAQIKAMANTDTAAGGADWPTEVPGSLPEDEVACAFLQTEPETGENPEVRLVSHPDVVIDVGRQVVHVQPAAGALVHATAGPGMTGPTLLVDQTGRAFPLPGASEELLGRLGYTPDDLVDVPREWMNLFPAGPALTVEGAMQAAEPVQAAG